MITNILLIFLPLLTNAQVSSRYEKDYVRHIQTLIGGQREVSVNSGRIDLVSGDTAFEVEWASNWKESIGQSLWYALQSNKKPGIILILRKKKDYKYFIQLNTALEYAGLQDKIKVYIYPQDFRKYMK